MCMLGVLRGGRLNCSLQGFLFTGELLTEWYKLFERLVDRFAWVELLRFIDMLR